MDFRFTEKELAWRDEVEGFLKEELPPRWAEESLSWPGGYGIISFQKFHVYSPFSVLRKIPMRSVYLEYII